MFKKCMIYGYLAIMFVTTLVLGYIGLHTQWDVARTYYNVRFALSAAGVFVGLGFLLLWIILELDL